MSDPQDGQRVNLGGSGGGGGAPSGAAGGDLSGTYPNPDIGTGVIVNADVNAAAAIAYSKLNLGTSIVNADVSTSAAIVASKLSGVVTVVGGGKETVQAHGAMGATETFDLANGNIHTGTLDAACTFTFSGTAASVACSMTLILLQSGAGSFTVTWPASVKWPAGTAPVLSTTAAKVDVFTFLTVDNGTTWYGFTSGLDLR